MDSPQFRGEPVIVIHLGTDDSEEGRWLAACTGVKFRPVSNSDYPKTPRVPCVACLKATLKENNGNRT